MKEKHPAGVAGLTCDQLPRPGRPELQDDAHPVALTPFSHLHVSPGTFRIGDERCTRLGGKDLPGSTQPGGRRGSVGGAPANSTHVHYSTWLGAGHRLCEARRGPAGPCPS